MNRILFVFMFSSIFGFGQVNAITEDGYQIQIFDDGTWKYLDTTLNEKRFIKENDTLFKVSKQSRTSVKSKIVDVQIKLDTEDWIFIPSSEMEDSEFSFNNKFAELYAVMITENVQIPIENLRNIALINARDFVDNLKIIKEEYRKVNDTKVLYLSFEGEVEKMKLIYNNYYYSGEDGVVQFITYAEKDVAKAENQKIFDLLNGFTKATD